MFNNLLQKQFTHLNRYREIIQILIKYNFISLIRHLKLDKHLSYREKLKLKKIKKKNKYGYWERYRLILQDLGPTFVKLGQILSNRHDVLPPELITEFTKLQQDVQPLPFTNIKNTIETELQKPLHKIFRHIDKKPLASASIAQVHKAALLNGRRVAVKIQRPDIKDRINTDLEITLNFAVLLEKYIPRTRNFRPVQIVKELKERIFEEINFINELNNMQRFKNNFEDNTDVYVPAVYKKYSTRKIVTMEFISGIKVTDLKNKTRQNKNRCRLYAEKGANSILRQIFDHGFFHADPHPGNIFIMDNNKICFLDFGMMGSLRPLYRRYLKQILFGLSEKNTSLVTKALLKIAITKGPAPDRHQLEEAVFNLIDKFADLPLSEIQITSILRKLFDIIITFNLVFPTSLTWMLKSLITIEGVGQKIYPQFQMMKIIKPYLKKIWLQNINFKNLLKKIYISGSEYEQLVSEFPGAFSDILNNLRSGNTKIIFQHQGLDHFSNRLDRITYRLVFGLVLAAILISSAIMVMADAAPHWRGIPLLGVAGFVISGIMGFGLLINIILKKLGKK